MSGSRSVHPARRNRHPAPASQVLQDRGPLPAATQLPLTRLAPLPRIAPQFIATTPPPTTRAATPRNSPLLAPLPFCRPVTPTGRPAPLDSELVQQLPSVLVRSTHGFMRQAVRRGRRTGLRIIVLPVPLPFEDGFRFDDCRLALTVDGHDCVLAMVGTGPGLQSQASPGSESPQNWSRLPNFRKWGGFAGSGKIVGACTRSRRCRRRRSRAHPSVWLA